ncbi:putative OsmC-like protein [Elusimicrobium posterum]|uniref:OsmC family protein n=1 Tax=Elusimicrobium posterum TaxID=3116653 RepID=UPI003C7433A4
MSKILTVYKGDGQCDLVHEATNTVLSTDLPLDNGGKGRKFSPTDLFASSFAACVLTIMGKMAERKGDDFKEAAVEIEKIMVENPRRVGKFILNIKFPSNFTQEQKDFYLAAVKACPVHNSLNPNIEVEIHVK